MRRALLGLLFLAACEPALEVRRYAVERAPVEDCVQVQGQVEQCQEPSPVVDRLPVVVERSADNGVVLFVGDPGSGGDRAYTGLQRGGVIQASRVQRSDEPGNGCSLQERADLTLNVDEETLSGAERRVVVESAACSVASLDRIQRQDFSWRGERVDAD